jgi:UDP:flavonoid glycosyltransferase YjiC (YdhE family)
MPSTAFFPPALAYSAVIVTHGGWGTIYQALTVGTVPVIIPQHLEHQEAATRVEELEVGCWVEADPPTDASIADALIRATAHDRILGAMRLARDLQGATGASRAAEIILSRIP